MQLESLKYLVGLVGPETLTFAESDINHPVHNALNNCTALEIRYDLFEGFENFTEDDCKNLSERVRKIAPNKLQIGTIRLKRDGGKFDDARIVERMDLWKNILSAKEVPDWIDLERDCLSEYKELNSVAKNSQILISEHNFCRVPTETELEAFAADVKDLGARGLKIAAMSTSINDCDRLYKFIKKYAKKFKMFAAFGMGKTGEVSRLWSLKEGANLTYGSIDKIQAPGQIHVSEMAKILPLIENMKNSQELLAILGQN